MISVIITGSISTLSHKDFYIVSVHAHWHHQVIMFSIEEYFANIALI